MFLKSLDSFFTEFFYPIVPNFLVYLGTAFFKKSRDCFFVTGTFSASVPPKNKVILAVIVNQSFVQLISFLDCM